MSPVWLAFASGGVVGFALGVGVFYLGRAFSERDRGADVIDLASARLERNLKRDLAERRERGRR